MKLRDAIEGALAKELQEEIDTEILFGILEGNGWKRIVLRPMTGEHGHEIDNWIVENCKGNHYTRGLVWMFEDAKDANWFALRWM